MPPLIRPLDASTAVVGVGRHCAGQTSKLHLSRLGAVFLSGEQARAAAQRLCRETGISPRRIRVLAPDDPGIGRKLRRCGRAGLIRSPCRRRAMGATGVLLGVSMALAFAIAGGAEPGWAALVALALIGLTARRCCGDLVAARPQEHAVIAWIKNAARGGRWFLLVHVRDVDEQRRVRASLLGMSPRVSGFF